MAMPARPTAYAFEVLPGLAAFAGAEVRAAGVTGLEEVREDLLLGRFAGDPGGLLGLRYVVAAYARLLFDIPRPKALLGDQHLRRLLGAVAVVRALHPLDAYPSFRFAAAGRDSSVFSRLAGMVEQATGLRHDPEDGALLLRVRPHGDGWEVLARLSPRPLSARAWRVCNLPGGLNATLAAVMNDLVTHDLAADTGEYLNAMCGSGTLLVERAVRESAARLVGCDLSEAALRCAQANLTAAGVAGRVTLLQADARSLPFEGDRFSAITCDLPWGDAVGSHQENAALYPAFLAEAARVATQNARLALLTHDLKLFARVLTSQSVWRVTGEYRVFHGGHYPRLYLLERA